VRPDHSIHRGDVFSIAAEQPGGPATNYAHPRVVVQEDVFNRSRISTVIVCALMTNLAKANEPGNILLKPKEGNLPKQSVVLVSQIDSVARSIWANGIGSQSDARVAKILSQVFSSFSDPSSPGQWRRAATGLRHFFRSMTCRLPELPTLSASLEAAPLTNPIPLMAPGFAVDSIDISIPKVRR
jgi:mRNA interferase MazF